MLGPGLHCRRRQNAAHHHSLAFTYDWIASEQERRYSGGIGVMGFGRPIMADLADLHRREGGEWPPRWDRRF